MWYFNMNNTGIYTLYIAHYCYFEKVSLIIYTVINTFHTCTTIIKIKYEKKRINYNY